MALDHLRDVDRSNLPDFASLLASQPRNGSSSRGGAGGTEVGVGGIEGDHSVGVFLSGDGTGAAVVALGAGSPTCQRDAL